MVCSVAVVIVVAAEVHVAKTVGSSVVVAAVFLAVVAVCETVAVGREEPG